MDILLSFFFLLISSIVGISLCLFLGMKSYLKIAIIVMLLFIPMELYNEFIYSNDKVNTIIKQSNPQPNSQPNEINKNNNINNNINNNVNNNINNTSTETTKYSDIKTNEFEMDKPPFDGLKPKELLNRLNYIHYATSNPQEPINYLEYKTHADKLLESDNTKLSSEDKNLLEYSKAHYPQLTKDQIDTKDCLNEGSNKNSCFQNPSLFFNVKNDFNILTKGVNEINANLLVREDFSNPMILDTNNRYEPILIHNSPNSNLDKILDNESNETIKFNNATSNTICKNCKLAVCMNDYCSLQNKLFI
jgi:hypothetical protein